MNKNYNIRNATNADLEKLLSLYRACGKDMWDRGFDNWGDFYPPVETIQKDIDQKTLFILEEKEEILGVVALDQIQPEVYKKVTWQYEGQILAIHRLAIATNHQKKASEKS